MGGCSLPQCRQKCPDSSSSRKHDQQVDATRVSGLGTTGCMKKSYSPRRHGEHREKSVWVRVPKISQNASPLLFRAVPLFFLRELRVSVVRQVQAENDDPQPHDFEELGLMKLKPCFISDSSQSSTIPAR